MKEKSESHAEYGILYCFLLHDSCVVNSIPTSGL